MVNKIIINGRFLSQPITGINRFAYEIIKRLVKLIDCEIVVPKQSIRKDLYDIKDFNIIEYGRLKSHLWEQISLMRYMRKNQNSILLSLSGLGPIGYPTKISTIHDLSFLYNAKWFSKIYYYLYKTITPLIIKTSLSVLTVSEFSKSEILKYYKIPESKITVVYNAVDAKFSASANSASALKDYVLTVGSLDPRKNFKLLLEAFKSSDLDSIDLHVVGSSNRVFGNLGISINDNKNIKFLGHVSDSKLKEEYQQAKLFVLPSLYEGFGIPPLEALASGCNVLLSDIPVFREIYGDAVWYFNPYDEEDVIKKIKTLFDSNQKIQQSRVDEILNRYSWEKSCLTILELILDSQNNSNNEYMKV